MHTVFALLCFVVVIHWLIFPYPLSLLHWHCGNLTIAPVPAKQPWWIWINTSCEFIMNDCITTTKQSTTKPCAYFLGYIVLHWPWSNRVPAPQLVKCLRNIRIKYHWEQGSWGQHGAHLGPKGPSWAACWPHEPCYLGYHSVNFANLTGSLKTISNWLFYQSVTIFLHEN